MRTVPESIARLGSTAVEIYRKALKNGASDRLAEMLASRQAPSLRTANTQFSGRFRQGVAAQYGYDYYLRLKREMERQGYVLGEHDCYNPTLADYFGDPRAVVHMQRDEVAVARDVQARREMEWEQQEREIEKLGYNPAHLPEAEQQVEAAYGEDADDATSESIRRELGEKKPENVREAAETLLRKKVI